MCNNLSARGCPGDQQPLIFYFGTPSISETNRAKQSKFGTETECVVS